MTYTYKYIVSLSAFAFLLCMHTPVHAAFSTEYLQERAAARDASLQQESTTSVIKNNIDTSQFNRDHAGATVDATAKGKGKATRRTGTVIEYVQKEEVVLPPLQDTGPALNVLFFALLGTIGGYVYMRRSTMQGVL